MSKYDYFVTWLYNYILNKPLSFAMSILEILLVILIVRRVIINMRRAKKQEHELKNLQTAKLTQDLTNPLWVEHGGKPDTKVVPYETKWDQPQDQISEGIRVEINIKGSGTDSKFIFVVQNSISVGKDESCSILVTDNSVEDKHLEIYVENGELMVRKVVPESMAVLERNNDYKKLDNKAYRLAVKDTISFGHSKLVFDEIG
ncbi:FHA domain-containing protein [Butyrivibrio sp. JL13D10]|uniref:FHA domain-containing protein n=1 Tax=Butyrivibrio sp. JL13D10 TaxID=3236815 RepID=UPI0038B5C960